MLYLIDYTAYGPKFQHTNQNRAQIDHNRKIQVHYTPLGKQVGILIVPMLEISRDAVFMKEKAPAGCS